MIVENTPKNMDLWKVDGQLDVALKRRLAQCLYDYVAKDVKKNQAFLALATVARLTYERIDDHPGENVDLKFTTENIVNNAPFEGKGTTTQILSSVWRKVTIFQEAHINGIQEFARRNNLEFYPKVVKEGTGGYHPSMYFVIGIRLPQRQESEGEKIPDDEVVYIKEMSLKPSWWAKPILTNGYILEGWRRKTFLGYWFLLIFTIVGICWIAMLPIFLNISFSQSALIRNLSFCALIVFCLWSQLKPMYRLIIWRITTASGWLLGWNEFYKENVQLEVVRTEEGSAVIQLVRYTGTCIRCKSKLELHEGGKEFPNRLVARCYENPAEHVFSFDRSTLRGLSLR